LPPRITFTLSPDVVIVAVLQAPSNVSFVALADAPQAGMASASNAAHAQVILCIDVLPVIMCRLTNQQQIVDGPATPPRPACVDGIADAECAELLASLLAG
jgi:hypothetical protein